MVSFKNNYLASFLKTKMIGTVVLFLMSSLMVAANANQLVSLTTRSMTGNRTQVILGFKQTPSVPNGFVIEKPSKLVLDFKNTSLALPKRAYNVMSGPIQSIEAASTNHLTRLVFNLYNIVPYHTTINGRQLIITMATPSGNHEAASAPKSSFNLVEDQQSHQDRIEKINFKRAKHNAGMVTLDLSNPNQAIDMSHSAGTITLTAYHAWLPPHWRTRMIVSDFGTPITSIDARQQGHNVKFVVHIQGKYLPAAYQANNKFVLQVSPKSSSQNGSTNSQSGKPVYTGQRISLNFQNIPVRQVLQILANFTNMNLVVNNQVKGNITLRLKNIPWTEALAIILQTQGLAKRTVGNIMMIAPASVLQKQEEQQLSAQKTIAQLAPIHTKIFQIRYAKATQIAALLKQLQSAQSNSKNNLSGLTARGKVVPDPRTNSLIIMDTQAGLNSVQKLLQKLDRSVKQVLIAARMVVAKQSFSRDIGVNFGLLGNGQFNVAANGSGTGSFTGNVAPVNGTATPQDSLSGVAGNNMFSVNLPAASPTSAFGITLAKLNQTFNLSLEISAAEQEGTVRQISSPRVITANDQPATIQQGTQIPYQEASSSGATAVSFKTAALELQVTPHITPNNHVLMNLTVSNNTVGGTYGGVPSINTQQVQTQVMVNNGQTVVLGGIYTDSKTHTTNKVPFLGDLPIIGNLFKERIKDDTKNELLIFITPKIINNNLSLAP